MTAMPLALSRPIRSNSRSVSRWVSEVVGSSKMMMRASALKALAISTSWRSPCDRRLTGVEGGTCRSTDASSSALRAAAARRSISGRPRTSFGNPSMNRFSATVRLRNRFSSWWMKAMPLAWASRGLRGW